MLTQPSTTAADDTTTRPRHQCSTAEASSTLALHFPAAEHDRPPAAQDAAAAARLPQSSLPALIAKRTDLIVFSLHSLLVLPNFDVTV